jgi:hypothetical protein
MWNDDPGEQLCMPFESDRDESKLITVHTFTNELEANLAKGASEAFGTDRLISRDDCGGQRPHLTSNAGSISW